jgi:hypothetical protein
MCKRFFAFNQDVKLKEPETRNSKHKTFYVWKQF